MNKTISIVVSILLCVMISACSTSYEYVYSQFTPVKVVKRKNYYNIKYTLRPYSNKTVTYHLSQGEYDTLTKDGSKDIMSIPVYFSYKTKIELD